MDFPCLMAFILYWIILIFGGVQRNPEWFFLDHTFPGRTGKPGNKCLNAFSMFWVRVQFTWKHWVIKLNASSDFFSSYLNNCIKVNLVITVEILVSYHLTRDFKFSKNYKQTYVWWEKINEELNGKCCPMVSCLYRPSRLRHFVNGDLPSNNTTQNQATPTKNLRQILQSTCTSGKHFLSLKWAQKTYTYVCGSLSFP